MQILKRSNGGTYSFDVILSFSHLTSGEDALPVIETCVLVSRQTGKSSDLNARCVCRSTHVLSV